MLLRRWEAFNAVQRFLAVAFTLNLAFFPMFVKRLERRGKTPYNPQLIFMVYITVWMAALLATLR